MSYFPFFSLSLSLSLYIFMFYYYPIKHATNY